MSFSHVYCSDLHCDMPPAYYNFFQNKSELVKSVFMILIPLAYLISKNSGFIIHIQNHCIKECSLEISGISQVNKQINKKMTKQINRKMTKQINKKITKQIKKKITKQLNKKMTTPRKKEIKVPLHQIIQLMIRRNQASKIGRQKQVMQIGLFFTEPNSPTLLSRRDSATQRRDISQGL